MLKTGLKEYFSTNMGAVTAAIRLDLGFPFH